MSSSKVVIAFNKLFYEFLKEVKRVARQSSPPLYKDLKSLYLVKERPDYVAHIERVTSAIVADAAAHKALCADAVADTVAAAVADTVAVAAAVAAANEDDVVIEPRVVAVDWLSACATLEFFEGVPISRVIEADPSDAFASQYVATLATLCLIHDADPSSSATDELLKCIAAQQSGKPVDYDAITDDDIRNCLQKIATASSASAGSSSASVDSFAASLENTTIGSLAKEIAKDIDLDKLNLEKPEDIFSGENAKLLGSIVNSVSSNLQNRFQNGTLDHKQLMQEAMGMLGDNTAIADMIKSMTGAGMMGGGGGSGRSRGGSGSGTRDVMARARLQRKLDKNV
jgi:hypothetical protein